MLQVQLLNLCMVGGIPGARIFFKGASQAKIEFFFIISGDTIIPIVYIGITTYSIPIIHIDDRYEIIAVPI